jgi:hypothetical protein
VKDVHHSDNDNDNDNDSDNRSEAHTYRGMVGPRQIGRS